MTEQEKVGHNSFVIPSITDEAAFRKDAEYRARRWGTSTRIHHHKFGQPCNPKCYVIKKQEEEDV